MIRIFVDADGCPVKEEVYRVAGRYDLPVLVVSNSPVRVPSQGRVEPVRVDGGFDAADDWIATRAGASDIVVTSDIPLAGRCIERGCRVLDPRGRVFTEDSIGGALAQRELMAYLREMGEVGGGPPPFRPRDRSMFLQKLDDQIQALLKAERRNSGP